MGASQAFVETITKDDLSGHLKTMADLIGLPAVRVLLRYMYGREFYIPAPRSYNAAVKRYIRANYAVDPDTGRDNARALAADIGMSARGLRQVMAGMKLKGKASPVED